MMQEDTPRLDNHDSGLGISEDKAPVVQAELWSRATQFALSAMAARSVLANGQTEPLAIPATEPISVSS